MIRSEMNACCDDHTFVSFTFYFYFLDSLLVNEHTVRLIMTHQLTWYTTFSSLFFGKKKAKNIYKNLVKP